EHSVGVFILGVPTPIFGSRLNPAGRRLLAMEAGVLVPGEQVHEGSGHSRPTLEVTQASRVNIDPAQAPPVGLDIADHRLAEIESLGAAAEAAAEMEVFEGPFDHGEFLEGSWFALAIYRASG